MFEARDVLPGRVIFRGMTVLCILTLVMYAVASGGPNPNETPNENDIPRAVSMETSLAGSDQPDISRFLNARTASSPSMAPDGEGLAFSTQISGSPQLWVADAAGAWPRQLTFGASITFHEWSPAGDWIIYGTDRGGDEREGYYLISPDGCEERELLAPSEAFRQFGGFTRDGAQIAYATTERNGIDYDIHLFDLETMEDREIFRGRMGLYVVSLRPDGSAVLLSEARGEDANDLFLFTVDTAKLDTLFQPEDRATYGSFSWEPDGSGFYLTSNQDCDYTGLAHYDLTSGVLEFIETPDHDVEQVAVSTDGTLLAWVTNEGGYSVLHLRDLRDGSAVPAPDLPQGLYGIDWVEGARVMSISVTGPRLPGDIWVWDAGTGAATRWTYSSAAGLDLSRMVAPEHHSFPARDGVILHGLFYRPPGLGSNARPPMLLLVHGGPTDQARPRYNASTQYLLTRGVAIFDLNYRGSTGYGKDFARLNDGRLRTGEYLDMADAIEWLDAQGLVDRSRVAVMGGSYGGYLAMAAMTRLPEYFKVGVAFVGISNWVTALEGAAPWLKAMDRVEYGDIGDPVDREFFAEISPIHYVADVQAPIMILHGANDTRCLPTESDEFVRGIRERGGEVEYLRFPDEGHLIRKLSNRIIAYRRIAAFLERTLELTCTQ